MMLVRLGSVGLSCHCVPKCVRPGNVRGPLYLGFEEVSVVTTVS